MSYSYTEKKRIRKNFGTFAKVMDLPNLIETQTKSYSEFLQADVAPEARKKQGLEEVFQSSHHQLQHYLPLQGQQCLRHVLCQIFPAFC